MISPASVAITIACAFIFELHDTGGTRTYILDYPLYNFPDCDREDCLPFLAILPNKDVCFKDMA
jgi:hypothetical protein